jgi:bifunctional DNA-binding transcriptional regulator/antitoxin component of YhaV-PrlF toxin-antitoxin module
VKTSVAVDKVGRLVLPKTVRDMIGVSGATTLQIEVVGGMAQITPAPATKTATRRVRGRLVYAGPVPEGFDSGEAVSAMRERRLRR